MSKTAKLEAKRYLDIAEKQRNLGEFEVALEYCKKLAELYIRTTAPMPIGLINAAKTIDTWSIGILNKVGKPVQEELLEALKDTLKLPVAFDEATTQVAIEKAKVILKAFSSTTNQDKKTTNFETSVLPFALRSLYIENYQCIKNISIEDIGAKKQFIVFTGENGDGKSSILQSIALGLFGNNDPQSKTYFCDNENTLISLSYQNSTQINTHSFENKILITPDGEKLPLLIAAYGVSRLQIQDTGGVEEGVKYGPTYNLFKYDGVLQSIEAWLKEEQRRGNFERMNAVISVLEKLMPNVEKIELNQQDSHVKYTEKGVAVTWNELSAGHKSVMAIFGDMLIRLIPKDFTQTNIENISGIVLIDEVESHLHPKWQREMLRLMSECFPKVQFVITTHSPIPFLGLPKNSVVYKVSRTEAVGTTIQMLDLEFENLTPNLLFTSPVFGMESIRNVNNKLEKVRTEETYIKPEETFMQILERLNASNGE